MPTIRLIPKKGPTAVQTIVCGTSGVTPAGSPVLDGSIDLSPFVNLTSFTCIGKGVAGAQTPDDGIVSLKGYNDKQNLVTLDCFGNNITGSIPNLSAMESLTNFRFYLNNLSGTFPNGNLPPASGPISIFNYGDNQITGVIPTEINTRTSLTRYSCYSNKHTGGVPSLTGLSNLNRFYCYKNELTGTLPSLAGLTALTDFQCYENLYVPGQFSAPGRGLSGSIPSLAGLTSLQTFSCYRNAFTGSIQPDRTNLTGLSALKTFLCYDNMLTGWIPVLSGVGLTSLETFECHDNNLSNPIPSLSGLTTLKNFDCGGNELVDNIPSLNGLTALQVFKCARNQLTGVIPQNLNQLASLQIFDCGNNKFSSQIPDLSGLNNLIEFACNDNIPNAGIGVTGINGEIPNLTDLASLAIFRCNDTAINLYRSTTPLASITQMPNTLNKFHAFNTNLDVASIGKILKAFHLSTKAPTTQKYINLGGNRPADQTRLAPGTGTAGTGYTIINPVGGSFVRAGNTVSVTLPSAHGYANGQLVTITSQNVKTTPGSNFSRSGNTVTVTLTSHGFINGQNVTINDVSDTSFQAALKVTNVPITFISANSFSYTTPTSGSLIGTGLATISDANFQDAFKGTFPITTTANPNIFRYTTATTGALTGAGISAIRSAGSAFIDNGFYYYQLLTSSTRAGGPWNIVTNMP